MPDHKDETAAAATIKNERTNKRGSVCVETVTSDVESGSRVKTSPTASSTTVKETSPKKRRKVNHGQDDNSVGPKSVTQDTDSNSEQPVSIVAVR